MKRIAMWAVLGLALAGCVVPSVYPFYQEKDAVFEPGLVGVWQEDGGTTKESWTFEKDGDKAYTFSIKNTETNVMSAHLFKLHDQLFLDCLTSDREAMTIPAHYLLKVDQIQPALKLATLNQKWLQEYLEKNPAALRHTLTPKKDNSDDSLVLTADTEELQKFIVKRLADTNLFVALDDFKPVGAK